MAALRNLTSLIRWQRNLDYFTTAYGYLPIIIPSLIVAPRYFAGELEFGDISQAGFAFSQVLDSVSVIVNQIEGITGFAASINRLGSFDEALQDPAERYEAQHQNKIQSQTDSKLELENVTVLTPNSEQTLVQNLSLAIDSGEPLLIVGVSGCGKSSLLRVIAGLWTNGQGSVTRPESDQMLFLPQRPYMLLGTLRDQLIYPHNRTDISDQELQKLLIQVNLEHLPERVGGLDANQDWSNVLSLGEQQRLAFARVLLTKPKYAILDEATSALDITNERKLYEQLQLLKTLYISVGHRPTLLQYHRRVLELDGQTGWKVMSVEEYAEQLSVVG